MHRTTFALDDATIRRMKRLAAMWKVSQAEVVRRSIEQAERLAEQEADDLRNRLAAYHDRGGLDARAADGYLEEVAEARSDWGRGE
jgi:predicted transcriptional regulator